MQKKPRKKQFEIMPYNSDWPRLFTEQKKEIATALGTLCIAVHHVGSTAVPGLVAKPKIDIIAVVVDGKASIAPLEETGFAYCGEWNIPFKYGFTRRGDVSVNLHVFEEGHPEIISNLMFRDYLRTHQEAREAYAGLKHALLKEPEARERKEGKLFAGYTLGKHDFIEKSLEKAGFREKRFLRCAHANEWKGYHELLGDQEREEGDGHEHLVWIDQGIVIGAAHLECLKDRQIVIHRIVGSDAFHSLVQKWMRKGC